MDRYLVWNTDDALYAIVSLLPAGLIIGTGEPALGVVTALGVLPICLLGIAARRRQRLATGVVGVLFGSALFIGSLLTQLHIVAVIGAYAVCYFATRFLAREAIGQLVLSLFIPVVIASLSFMAIAEGIILSLAFAFGAVWATLMAFLWPERPEAKVISLAIDPEHARSYGVLLGLAAVTSLLVSYGLGVQHAGWLPAATVLVMRPLPEMVQQRGIARAIATIFGTVLAVTVLHLALGAWVLAIVVVAVAAATVALRSSPWYVTSVGVAFLLLTLVLHGSAPQISVDMWLRVLDSVVGAAIALLFGLWIPRWFALVRE